MNILLIFFALPIATIIIAIILQKIIKCPTWVALFVFAIYLIVAFAIFDATFLVAAIAYSILAFIAAFLTMLFCRFAEREQEEKEERRCRRGARRNERCDCERQDDRNPLLTISSVCPNRNGNGRNGDLLTISSNGCNGVQNDLLTIRSHCNNRNSCNGNWNQNCNCNCCWCCGNGRGNNNGANNNALFSDTNVINGVMTLSENGTPLNTNSSNCGCNNNNNGNSCNANNTVSARVNVIPNSANGRTGCLCGSYRRN